MSSAIAAAIAVGQLPPDTESARAAGRELAREVCLPRLGAAPGAVTVEALVSAGLARLAELGVRVEVVRSRPNFLVVRSATSSGAEALHSCAFVSSWLESLPLVAHGTLGTVVESSCSTRGAKACIHTLLWQAPEGAEPAVDAEPEPGGAQSAPHAPSAPSVSARSSGTVGSQRQLRSEAAEPSHPPVPPVPDGWAHLANEAFHPVRTSDGRAARKPAPAAPPQASSPQPAARKPAPSAPPRTSSPQPAARKPAPSAPPRTSSPQPAARKPAPAAPISPSASPSGPPAVPTPLPAVRGSAAPRADRSLAPAPSVVDSWEIASPAARLRPMRGGRRWAWLRRRAWLLALGLVAGAVGGYYASGHHSTSYSATSVLVVRSGASPTGPGGASEAGALAVTDAALMPSDQTVVDEVATELHVLPSVVSSSMTVQAEAGTALMEVRFAASTPAKALAGANDLASVVSGTRVNDQAIPSGSIAVVSRPKEASRSGSLGKKGLPLGAALGLLLGGGAALVAERTDRRVDEAESLGDATGSPVTVVPGGISPVELARALDRSVAGGSYALVPLRAAQADPASQLASELSGGGSTGVAGQAGPPVRVTVPFADAPDAVCRGEGPTVLVVGAGERLRTVAEVVERLRRVDRRPVWSVLVAGG